MKNWWEDDKEALTDPPAGQVGRLFLYVAGPSPRAEQAEANVRRCCQQHFAGQYELEVVDVRQHPERAGREQLLALPALVRQHPQPKHYLVGTLTNEAQLLSSLRFGEER